MTLIESFILCCSVFRKTTWALEPITCLDFLFSSIICPLWCWATHSHSLFPHLWNETIHLALRAVSGGLRLKGPRPAQFLPYNRHRRKLFPSFRFKLPKLILRLNVKWRPQNIYFEWFTFLLAQMRLKMRLLQKCGGVMKWMRTTCILWSLKGWSSKQFVQFNIYMNSRDMHIVKYLVMIEQFARILVFGPQPHTSYTFHMSPYAQNLF